MDMQKKIMAFFFNLLCPILTFVLYNKMYLFDDKFVRTCIKQFIVDSVFIYLVENVHDVY